MVQLSAEERLPSTQAWSGKSLVFFIITTVSSSFFEAVGDEPVANHFCKSS